MTTIDQSVPGTRVDWWFGVIALGTAKGRRVRIAILELSYEHDWQAVDCLVLDQQWKQEIARELS